MKGGLYTFSRQKQWNKGKNLRKLEERKEKKRYEKS